MAEAPKENSEIGLQTNLFGVPINARIGGPNAATIFLFLAVLALSALTFWEHVQRSLEHDQIACQIKLNLFMYSIPKGSPIDWEHMPVDLYPCVPRFLYDRKPQ